MDTAVLELIEEERGRLMRAHAFLSCLLICMGESPQTDRDEPDYSEIVDAARELVNTTINNLDSAKLQHLTKSS